MAKSFRFYYSKSFLKGPQNLKKWFDFLKDLLFPRYCFGCQKEGEYLCEDCLATLEIFERQFCPICQKPTVSGKACSRCQRKSSLKGLFCATSYEGLIEKMIHSFKYSPFIRELAKPLSFLIIAHFSLLDKRIEGKEWLMVPIPLSKKRLKWRGFNQAVELAKILSRNWNLEYGEVLIRRKEVSPQAELKKEERWKNVKEAFEVIQPELVKRKKILLVDDVFTTGATLQEASRALKKAGAKEVWGIVICKES
jgi:ComF family protein